MWVPKEKPGTKLQKIMTWSCHPKEPTTSDLRHQVTSEMSLKCSSNMEGCFFLVIFNHTASWNQKEDLEKWNHRRKQKEQYKGFQSGLMSDHMYIRFYMVVGKWFAPCGKCEENWGHWAWVIGELSLRGMEVLPLSAGLGLLFTFQTEELRGTRRGKTVGRNVP